MTSDRIILERRFIAAGDVVCSQGDEAYYAYLLQSGRVRVYITHENAEKDLAMLGPGQIFGELALISDAHTKRTANVQAVEDCNLIIITRNAFKEKISNTDPTIAAVLEMLCDRICRLNYAYEDHLGVNEFNSILGEIIKKLLDGIDESKRLRFNEIVLPKLTEAKDLMKSI